MKIIRLTTFLDFGGVERRLVTLSHAKDANEWIFCALNKGGVAEKSIAEQKKKVVCLGLPYRIPNLLTLLKLYRFFKKEKPQVVHTSGAEANFHGVLAAKLAGVPTVVAEEIGIPAQGKVAKNIFRMIYWCADYVVGNSKPVLSYLESQNGVSMQKIRLIANPIVFPTFEPKQINTTEIFKMVSVSRLEPVKNIESILRTLQKLIQQGYTIHYMIVGEGKHRGALEQLVSDLTLTNYVTFAGFQSNPYPFLNEADLYLLTSFTEGFSNSLVEAMYSKTPSLSTKVGAAGEIIADGTNGWLVEPDSDEALFQKIKEIIALDAAVRTEVAEKGHKDILENFSLEKHLNQLMELYS